MDVRRGARVATSFSVAIEGLDAEPTARRGDVSVTGIYFETDQDVGAAGTIHWLHLVSADGARHLRVMAYVVRTAFLTGPTGGRIGGAAFEFMPESSEVTVTLHDFVRYALALRQRGSAPHISPRLEASAVPAGAAGGRRAASPKATVRELGVRSLVLETSWSIEPGEAIHVEIVAPGMKRRIRLDGRATRVERADTGDGGPRYTIGVAVVEESDGPLARGSTARFRRVRPREPAPSPSEPEPRLAETDERATGVLENLLSALVVPPVETHQRAHHLSGQISRVRLPTLCALFEMERMTGELIVRRGDDEARIYLSEGRLVDVTPLADGETVRARLQRTLFWEEGSFEFYVQPVDRSDSVGSSTTALLLDLARVADESARDGAL